ncbi:serine/threonine protein kinase [Gemmata sp. G18]|uniref:Serine/threonine protein kinase n=1 Tax=Gemmata palustris TaxID=2822762 RepID=A0ABS5BV42_9BACT|nr:serine/threonine-protein kinase [Gemmata palustris]MBP3956773.1 serine/threonine protein kinase [Gemmata palustris]
MPDSNDPARITDPRLGSLLISASDHFGVTKHPASWGSAALAFGPPVAGGEVGTLGPYRVVKELGRGAMGAVYLARDTRLDRDLALKVMLPEFTADAEAKERFLREAKAAARISHDNVVTVYEADERDGIPYIAMQLLQGVSLDAFLQNKGAPALRSAVRIAREAALGLAAAHELGTVHRDIKPANLWLEAPRGRVKLLDFGLARPGGADNELTKSGAVLGTPAFMSPEQALGERVDHRTDLFSLGAVLYLLCTRQLPFQGASVGAVLLALGTKEPKPVRAQNVNVPESLAELIHQLLAKDPERRPQTAAAVANRLQEILEQPAGLAAPGTAEGPGAPPAPSNSQVAGADPWTTRTPSSASQRGGHLAAKPGEPRLLRSMAVVAITPPMPPDEEQEEKTTIGATRTVISSGVLWEGTREESRKRAREENARGEDEGADLERPDRPRRRKAKGGARGKKARVIPVLIGTGAAVLVAAFVGVALIVAGGKPKATDSVQQETVKGFTAAKRGDEVSTIGSARKDLKNESPTADGGPIDLLALADPKAHAVLGEWKKNGKSLVGVNPTFPGVLQLPYEPGDEYDIEATVRRVSGDEYFGFQLVAGGHRINVAIDTWPSKGYFSGMGNIAGESLLNNGTGVKGRQLVQAGTDYAVACSVRKGKIDVLVNGTVITSYKGAFTHFWIHSDFRTPNEKALAIQIGYTTPFQIDRLVVTPVSGNGKILK